MPLFLADVHLTRARLFRDHDELTQATGLIRAHGYGRRYDELADAEAALVGDREPVAVAEIKRLKGQPS